MLMILQQSELSSSAQTTTSGIGVPAEVTSTNVQPDLTLTCEVCNKKFVSSSAINVRTCLHTSEERPVSCNVCDKKLNDSSSLRRHMHTHTAERRFSCDVRTVEDRLVFNFPHPSPPTSVCPQLCGDTAVDAAPTTSTSSFRDTDVTSRRGRKRLPETVCIMLLHTLHYIILC